MIRLENVTKSFDRNGESFAGIDNISIELADGTMLAITGHSGSGKTTLLNIIAGVMEADEGTVIIDDVEFSEYSPDERTKYRNTNIGYVLQGDSLLGNFTILQNVCMPAILSKSVEGCMDRALELLNKMGLSNLENEYPAKLSGGEMRRVAIARALINNPRLILADEPTSNLDPENSKIVMDVLKEICRDGTTVIFSTHDSEYLEYADKTIEICKGKIK